MSRVLIVAEHLDGKLGSGTARCVTAARRIEGAEVHVAVLAADVAGVAAQAAAIQGVAKVLTVQRPENAQALAATLAPQVVKLAAGYTHLFAPSSTFGKDLLPRVAGMLDAAMAPDISAVLGARQFRRASNAGNV